MSEPCYLTRTTCLEALKWDELLVWLDVENNKFTVGTELAPNQTFLRPVGRHWILQHSILNMVTHPSINLSQKGLSSMESARAWVIIMQDYDVDEG